jgi:hypothetical protein
MRVESLAALLLAVPALALGAESVATITILEGDAAILRGGSRLTAAEGVRLHNDDVLETASKTFLRLEYTPGPILDLGAGTRLMLGSTASTGNARPALYLLAGWLKLTRHSEAGGQAVMAASPRMDLTDLKGVAVMQVGVRTSSAFIESGQARVVDRRPRFVRSMELLGGEYVELEGQKVPVRAPRPSAVFLAAVPVPFRDSLPARLPIFAERNVAPRDAGTFNYKDVEEWLNIDRTLGRRLVRVWGAKANDPAFRADLIANLAEHPEWFPVLYPNCCNTVPADSGDSRAAGTPPAPVARSIASPQQSTSLPVNSRSD